LDILQAKRVLRKVERMYSKCIASKWRNYQFFARSLGWSGIRLQNGGGRREGVTKSGTVDFELFTFVFS